MLRADGSKTHLREQLREAHATVDGFQQKIEDQQAEINDASNIVDRERI